MSIKILEEYFSCPICLEILKNPITTLCGHNFCKVCIIPTLNNCPICKSEVNLSEINVNYQLKNIIESIKCLDNQTLKYKFFPEIKEDEIKKKQELKLLITNIFGIDFVCSSDQCRETIKNFINKILSDDKQFLIEIVLHINKKIKHYCNEITCYNEENKPYITDLLCISCKNFFEKYINERANSFLKLVNDENAFSIKNPFKTVRKRREFIRNKNKENRPVNSDKMEFEISTEKYFNNSNRDKNIFFNVKGNTENVFRVKRNRCELLENLENKYWVENLNHLSHNDYNINTFQSLNPNNPFNDKNFAYNNYICSSNKNDKKPNIDISSGNNNLSIVQKKNINFNFISINNFENKNIIGEQNCRNQDDVTARRIEFDTSEVDKNLNCILKNFSKKDMLKYEDTKKKENKIFSHIITDALEDNCINYDSYNDMIDGENCGYGETENLDYNIKYNNLLNNSDFPVQSINFSNDNTNKLEQNLAIYQDTSNINFQIKLRKLK